MKSNLLSIAAIFLHICGYAQGSYTLSVTNESYIELTDDTELSYSAAEGGYYYAANLIFPVLGRGASFESQANPPSNGAYITPQGYVAIYEWTDFQNTIVLHGYYHPYFEPIDGFTRVSAKLEGSFGTHVLKIQWKNLALEGDTTKRMNFQMWFNESNSSVQYRFGPSTLVATGGYCGMMVFDPAFSTMLDAYNLSGEIDDPQPIENLTDFSTLPYLNGTPNNETVYTFSPLTTAIATHQMMQVRIFPTLATDFVTLAGAPAQQFFVFNAVGQIVKTFETESKTSTLSVSDLPEGVYMVYSMNGYREKFLIQR